MLCICGNSKGDLCYELLKPGETVKAKIYKEQLQKLNQKIQELRPHQAHTARKVLLLHDNARLHFALATKDTILELGWEPLLHPSYSPDLAPLNNYLFRYLQHSLSE